MELSSCSGHQKSHMHLVRYINPVTGQEKKMSQSELQKYLEKHKGGGYRCKWKDCEKPLGRYNKAETEAGMTESGFKSHLATHMGLKYQCLCCNATFDIRSTCYKHVASCYRDFQEQEFNFLEQNYLKLNLYSLPPNGNDYEDWICWHKAEMKKSSVAQSTEDSNNHSGLKES